MSDNNFENQQKVIGAANREATSTPPTIIKIKDADKKMVPGTLYVSTYDGKHIRPVGPIKKIIP